MKNPIYYVVFAAVLFFFSCHKEKEPDNTCDKILVAFNPISNNGWYANHLIMIDTANGRSLTSFNFSFVSKFEGNASYNSTENCFYVMQHHAGKTQLLRYNLNSNKTDSFTFSGVFDTTGYYLSILFYNSKSNKLYYVGGNGNGNSLYELNITGQTCYTHEVFPSAHNTYILSTAIDESTGDIYYIYFDDNNSTWYIKMLKSGSTTPLVVTALDRHHFKELEFNNNDKMLYGISTSRDTVLGTISDKCNLYKINPINGAISDIGMINFGNRGGNLFRTFDICNNQLVLYRGGTSSFEIYWVDITNGKVVKHLTSSEYYWGLTFIDNI